MAGRVVSVCTRCGAEVVAGAKKCPGCGGRYATMPLSDDPHRLRGGGITPVSVAVAGLLAVAATLAIGVLLAMYARYAR